MKLAIISVLSAIVITAVALNVGASNDAERSQNGREQWLPRQQIEAQLNRMGYQVHRLEADDGCIEAYLTDRHGIQREWYVDPVTGLPGCRGESEDHES